MGRHTSFRYENRKIQIDILSKDRGGKFVLDSPLSYYLLFGQFKCGFPLPALNQHGSGPAGRQGLRPSEVASHCTGRGTRNAIKSTGH